MRIFLLLLLGLPMTLTAQKLGERIKENTKNQIENRLEQRSGEGVEKGMDKIEEKAKGKKEKKNKKSQVETTTTEKNTGTENNTPAEINTGADPGNTSTKGNGNTAASSLNTYSKFDFVPGEKITWYDDFSDDAVGDFPVNWNTNASGEVITMDNQPGRLLMLGKQGVFTPEKVQVLSKNFTLEFDMVASGEFSEMKSGLKVYFVQDRKSLIGFDQWFDSSPQVGFDLHPVTERCYGNVWARNRESEEIMTNNVDLESTSNQVIHVSVWRQNTRVRVYVNDKKIWDLPKVFFNEENYRLLFACDVWNGNINITNLRLAEGTPDMRSKLVTEGRLVTNGITFDVNAARIKNESYGTLKDIAQVLKENPTVKVKIVGHTDADGEAETNLRLSEQRAIAVKEALQNEFGIEGSRMQTEGKGEQEPIQDNNSASGKAANRRVEFIQQ